MKALWKRAAVAGAMLAAAVPGVASADAVYSYSYYECNFGVCQLITCVVYDDDFRGTTQEICSPDIGGGIFMP